MGVVSDEDAGLDQLAPPRAARCVLIYSQKDLDKAIETEREACRQIVADACARHGHANAELASVEALIRARPARGE